MADQEPTTANPARDEVIKVLREAAALVKEALPGIDPQMRAAAYAAVLDQAFRSET